MLIRLNHTLIITIGCFISKILGLFRDASIAWVLGNTLTADALTIALRLPFLFRRLLGEGILSIALVQICQHEELRHNTGVKTTLYITQIFAISISIIVIMFTIIPQLPLTILAPGFYNKHLLTDETIYFFRICLPYTIFSTLAAGGIAILYTKRLILLPFLSPLVFNCIMLTAAYIAIDYPTTTAGTILAYSVLLGGILQWFIQVPSLLQLKKPEPHFLKNIKKLKKQLIHIPTDIFTASIPQLTFIFASILTSLLPTGHVSTLFYAERIIEFPIGIIGSALGIITLPRFIELHHKQKISTISQELLQQIRLSSCIYLPAATGIMLIANPLIQIVFYHGAFNPQAINLTTLALYAYAPGLPATALVRILIAGNYSFNQHRKPFFFAIISLVISIISGFIFMHLLGIIGPPLGTSLGLWIYCFLLWKNLSKHIHFSFPIKTLIMQFIAAIHMFILNYILIVFLPIEHPLFILAVIIPTGIVSYGLILLAIDKKQIQELLKIIKKNITINKNSLLYSNNN